MGFAAAAVEAGAPAAGACLLAAALNIGGRHFASAWAATKLEYEHYSSLLHNGLTEEEFEREQMLGTRLTYVQATAYAQQIFDLRELNIAVGKKTGDLTAREREIAVLIGQGKTNGEVAEELVLSKRTIEKHMAHILIKLGFANRAQIVRWAIENGLVKPTQQ